ncbi:MAG: hypothetical protein WBD22_02610 [Pyrinomonadaceae bacterium]
MARDRGLEELIHDDLDARVGVTEKAMFGGWAWLLNGNLLCGARDDGMLVRLGKGLGAWALETTGIVPMESRGRIMQGWVRCGPAAYGNDVLRNHLLSRASEFVSTLQSE